MATSAQIATRALRRLRVVAADQTPAAADLTAATDALDAMIASWETVPMSGDVLPLDARFEDGITAMLAVRLSGDYGRSPDAILLRDAQRGEDALRSAFFAVPTATFDAGLVATADDFSGSLLQALTAWAASTDYTIRQHVVLNGNIYECVTAGTSGTTGPSGTTSSITDGTVTWCWRRVSG